MDLFDMRCGGCRSGRHTQRIALALYDHLFLRQCHLLPLSGRRRACDAKYSHGQWHSYLPPALMKSMGKDCTQSDDPPENAELVRNQPPAIYLWLYAGIDGDLSRLENFVFSLSAYVC